MSSVVRKDVFGQIKETQQEDDEISLESSVLETRFRNWFRNDTHVNVTV